MLGFAFNFGPSVVDDFVSSTAFFTASAADVVASLLCAIGPKDFPDLPHLLLVLMSL